MTTYPYAGVDTSWPQGDYKPGTEEFVIVGAATGDGGTLAVQSTYHEQVANARAAGKEVGHYFFNGGDPTSAANFFTANLYDFEAGDTLWLDVESQSNGTAAWTPAQALTFLQQVKANLGVLPGIYLNDSEMTGEDWSALVSAGVLLWLAYYSTARPTLKWWTIATIWQHADTPIDQDLSLYTQAQIRATQNGAPTVRKDPDMYISLDTSGTEYLHTDLGTVTFNQFGNYPNDTTVGPAQIAALFTTLLAGGAPKFNPEQEQVIAWFQAQTLAALLPAAQVTVAPTAAQITQISTAVASAVTAAVPAGLTSAQVTALIDAELVKAFTGAAGAV